MALPPPAANQAYCDVSALEAGTIQLPLSLFTTSATPGVISHAPSLAFLLQHSSTKARLVFDLGIRKNWKETYTPELIQLIEETWKVEIPQDVAESLTKGGISPADITTICLSHVHFDHVGDPTFFPQSTFLVGVGGKEALETPNYPNPLTLPNLLPKERVKYLSPSKWPPLGPFPHALDYYGDGSLYIVDAPGHFPGHLNMFARTSADGAWIYLAGDSAHNWDLITGKGDIVTRSGLGSFGCAHLDKEAAEEHNLRIRNLLDIPRVHVLLAHDEPWYEVNKGGPAFWPGKIPSRSS